MPKPLIEPFKIKVVEPIYSSSFEERELWIKQAHYNVFNLKSSQVMIDLLTDSGTSAMSQAQWGAMIDSDESYAGSKGFDHLESTAKRIFNKNFIIPVHQGRAGEHLVFSTLVQPGMIIPSNSHFDTTAGNILERGAVPKNFPTEEGTNPFLKANFKGNMNVKALREFLVKNSDKVPFVMITITNNTGGGQPVSLQNIKETASLAREFDKELFIDGCRFAENCMFIKKLESGYENKSILEIAREVFSFASLIIFSAKKDAFGNIGGLVCVDNEELSENLKNRLILYEGFPSYGGLAGRDLSAIAIGLEEVLSEDYLNYRLRTIEWMVERLDRAGVPVLVPSGGHAVYIESSKFNDHIQRRNFPGIALTTDLYLRGGIRAVELGTVAFGSRDESGNWVYPPLDLVRLAIPRRVYTEAHAGYIVETVIESYQERRLLKGFDFEYEAPVMRHFRSRFKML